MFKTIFLVFVILLISSLNSKSQINLANWKTYSLSFNTSLDLSGTLLQPLSRFETIQLNDGDFKFEDKMSWINKTIESITFNNANQTILGNDSFKSMLLLWDIYQDYYSVDTFEYVDLNVLIAY